MQEMAPRFSKFSGGGGGGGGGEGGGDGGCSVDNHTPIHFGGGGAPWIITLQSIFETRQA